MPVKDNLGGSTAKPLAGLKVADFSTMIAGPLCARYLADMGAEVVKIESPPLGDPMRVRPPQRDGLSAYYGHLNAGKQSIALDLKAAADLPIARSLANQADIVIENFRPGVMRRFGLGYSQIRETNRGVVYCSISGFGQDGPDADRPAFAQIIHAASGFDLAFMSYQDAPERPSNSAIFIADVLGASYALAAVLAGLRQRDQTSEGQYVDVTLMESMMNLLVYEFQAAQFPVTGARAIFRPTKTRDGFVMITPTTQKNFEGMWQAADRPDWAEDPRFQTNASRFANWTALMEEVERWTIERSTDTCVDLLTRAGVPCSAYHTMAEAQSAPQMQHLNSFARVNDKAGSFLVPNVPFRMAGTDLSVAPNVSAYDEDRESILAKLQSS